MAPHDFHESIWAPGLSLTGRARCGLPACRHVVGGGYHGRVSDSLSPDLPALRTIMLDVGDGHALHVQTWGSARGLPAVVLHGGPGSGFSPLLRRFFDPHRFHVICIDQRGAGRSTPTGATRGNDTAALLRDLRRVRASLGIDRWLVAGGSWGATLAIGHALDDPQAVAALLLRATFLARPHDIERFFRHAPAALRDGWAHLHELPDDAADALALAWWRHERQVAGAVDGVVEDPPPTTALRARYRIQSHYLRHGCWLQDPPLAARCTGLPTVPTLLLHAHDDPICPPDGALEVLHSAPWATLRWADGSGHDPAHPAMVAAMRRALDHYADHGVFEGRPA